jgi:transposase
MRAYSVDLRQRVLAACDGGLGTAEAAETFAVSEAWVRRIKQRRREAGELAPRVRGRTGPAPVLAAHLGRLAALAKAAPGLTPAEYRDRLGVAAAPVTVWRALRALGLTFKKKSSAPPSRAARRSPPGGPSGARA